MSKIKNIGPFLAFDEKWFRKYQRILIWMLNAPVLKIWFRWVLRIRKCDCTLSERINLILPNQFHKNARIEGDKIFATADFRTHWKYSKRIYHAFSFVWWALHFWDWLIADRFLPELSFGLFTLNINSAPAFGGESCDGYIYYYFGHDSTLSSIEIVSEDASKFASVISSTVDTSNTGIELAYAADDSQVAPATRGVMEFVKAFFFFNTSLLDETDITNARLDISLSIYRSAQEKGIGVAGLFSANGSSSVNNLNASDYYDVGTTMLANGLSISAPQLIPYTDPSYPGMTFYSYYSELGGVYYSFILNSAGLSNILKTGVTKFATRWTFGSIVISNAPVTNYNNMRSEIGANAADAAGITSDPKLVIDYSISSTNKIQMII